MREMEKKYRGTVLDLNIDNYNSTVKTTQAAIEYVGFSHFSPLQRVYEGH